MTRGGSIYIMTNKLRATLYIGVTADLYSRIQEHKQHFYKGSFTDKYNLEIVFTMKTILLSQKQLTGKKKIKKWRREKKDALIKTKNPYWTDLWEEIKLW